MVVEKKEIVRLQKYVERRIEELRRSGSADSTELFDLNMLDSNISLFLLAAEFKEDPVTLGPNDKLIRQALRTFRYSLDHLNGDGLDEISLAQEIAASANEILEMIQDIVSRLEEFPDSMIASNFMSRFSMCGDLLRQVARLKGESRRTLKAWNTERMPLPLSGAGTILGQCRSEKKAAASRINGAKGGRPPKNPDAKKAAASRKKASAEKKSEPAKKTPAKQRPSAAKNASPARRAPASSKTAAKKPATRAASSRNAAAGTRASAAKKASSARAAPAKKPAARKKR